MTGREWFGEAARGVCPLDWLDRLRQAARGSTTPAPAPTLGEQLQADALDLLLPAPS